MEKEKRTTPILDEIQRRIQFNMAWLPSNKSPSIVYIHTSIWKHFEEEVQGKISTTGTTECQIELKIEKIFGLHVHENTNDIALYSKFADLIQIVHNTSE